LLPEDAIVIDMDPGLAFGTGTHQTTDLCLQYLDENPPIDHTVIDYGSGTGVLAIAAVKLGAKSAVAVDNDPQAVLSTIDNVRINQVDEYIKVLHTDDESGLNKVDLLVANILANPLVELCEHFSALVKSGGKITLSGILQEQLEMVLEAYRKNFSDLKVKQKDDWCRVDGTRK
jgi:ribosomal protein L11 methyltransferase